MGGLVRHHVRFGEWAARVFWIHLLWIGLTLAGGIVVGFFPATAAAYAAVRVDLYPDTQDRSIAAVMWRTWRAELGRANLLGWPLVGVGALLALGLRLDPFAPSFSGARVLTIATLVAWSVLALVVWPLFVHFDESVAQTVRRALVLIVARPVCAASLGAVAAVVAGAYDVVPGLAPVFGTALPAWLTFALLRAWRVLPVPGAIQLVADR